MRSSEKTAITHPELQFIIMPDGAPHLEYAPGHASLDAHTRTLQDAVFSRWESDPEEGLLFLGFCDYRVPLSPSLDYLRQFAAAFVHRLRRTPDIESLRHKAVIPLDADLVDEHLQRAPLMTGAEYLGPDVLSGWWQGMNRAFSRAIQNRSDTVEAFLQSYRPDVHLAGRVYFHLVENKDGNLPFAFLATYATRLDEQGKSRHLPLRHALQEYGADSKHLLDLLTTVHRAADKSALVAGLMETGEIFHPLAWTAGEAFTFLKEAPIYEECGVLCRIPDWWKAGGAGLRMTISIGDKKPSMVGMDAILQFSPRLVLGGMGITEDEARRLLAESEGLAFIKNRWVAADPEKIRQTLEAYEKAADLMAGGISLRDAMRMQLHPEKWLDETDAKNIGVSNGKWLASVMEKMIRPDQIPPVSTGKDFLAELRPYQQQGLNWLWFLHSLGFGACLADDMGLGKTIQLLGFISALTAASNGPSSSKKDRKSSLLIIPASLIANWTSEIERFSPRLKFLVCHPSVRRNGNDKANGNETGNGNRNKKGSRRMDPSGDTAAADLDAWDLVITTYALVQRYDHLRAHAWQYVILDEAQVIKNPGTKQTRVVKQLIAENRIIMTGTPVENRLADLWSLFDFLNPGLLGTAKTFGTFAKNISDSPSGYARLRKVISPYILRRLKTDKSVIRDLPDKVEMKTYADMSKKQVLLYSRLVDDIARIIEETDGIQRKGMILSALMKFKQICNHPDQYLGTGAFDEIHSGKFDRLREICETIYAKRERVLVFTQFKEMTEPLREFLAGIFQRDGLVLHGSVPVGKRRRIVESFQGGGYVPFMVLSLKAGGVGLNLTAASHVIHFDRWWNPAVENQATDRAFRIGQKKNVMVHKFVTRGTVEEKIDRMLTEKAALSDRIVAATGEHWITEMKSDELMDLLRLSL